MRTSIVFLVGAAFALAFTHVRRVGAEDAEQPARAEVNCSAKADRL